MELDLAFLFAGLIAFAVLAYVVFDGFDLGIGILFPFFPEEDHRDTMVNSIAPVWDGNETWLVAGGGGLLAGFPLAYGIVLPALYAPLTAMVLALIFRGVAFEFRFRSRTNRRGWDLGFALGSLVAALAQGIAVGALVQGIPVANRAYAGGWWDWLTPFTMLTGAALVAGYALLGATWLVVKTTGELQAEARRWAGRAGLVTLAAIAMVSAVTPFLQPVYRERWFAWPAILYTMPVPLLVVGVATLLFRSLARRRSDYLPFFSAIGLFVLSYIGLAISLHPWIVPPTVTIQDAASPDSSLAFVLVGAAVLLPIILAYTAYSYWVFRGKVSADVGYH
jgi:cytochrome d ubiquinol oxidase subunit II